MARSLSSARSTAALTGDRPQTGGRVFSVTTLVGDVLLLELLWLVTCLGVVTIAPATYALQRALHDVVVETRPRAAHLFFSHFAAGFRRLWLIGTAGVVVALLYAVALLFWLSALGPVGIAALVVLVVVGGAGLSFYFGSLAAAPSLPDDAPYRQLMRASGAVLAARPLAAAGRIVLMATWLILLARLPTLGLIGLGLVPAFLSLTLTWRPWSRDRPTS